MAFKNLRAPKGCFFGFNLIFAVALLVLAILNWRESHALGLNGILIVIAVGIGFCSILGSSRANMWIFLGSCGCFCFLEWRLPRWFPKPALQVEALRVPRPYFMFSAKPSFDVDVVEMTSGKPRKGVYHFNHLGFRIEKPLTKVKPPGEFRVFVLGGSTVFVGTTAEETLPGHLEKIFQSAAGWGRHVSVYNFGTVSAVSSMELALLLHELVDYKPDLVITYDGANDVVQPLLYDPRPGYPFNFVSYEEGLNRIRGEVTSFKSSLAMLFSNSSLLSFLFRRVFETNAVDTRDRRSEVNYRSETWEREIVQIYTSNLQKACRMSKVFGFRYAAFLQPLIFHKKPLSEVESKIAGAATDVGQHSERLYSKIRPFFGSQTFSDVNPCLYSDLSNVFGNTAQQAFIDFVHVNDFGNSEVAKNIFKQISRTFPVSSQ